MYFDGKFNSKAGLFSSTFWFEHSFGSHLTLLVFVRIAGKTAQKELIAWVISIAYCQSKPEGRADKELSQNDEKLCKYFAEQFFGWAPGEVWESSQSAPAFRFLTTIVIFSFFPDLCQLYGDIAILLSRPWYIPIYWIHFADLKSKNQCQFFLLLLQNNCRHFLFSRLRLRLNLDWLFINIFSFFNHYHHFLFSRRVSNILAYCHLFSVPYISSPGYIIYHILDRL